MSGEDLSDLSMLELFRAELAAQSQAFTTGLLALERDPTAAVHLEACMRAAHSLKGAARIIDLTPAVQVAHEITQRGSVRGVLPGRVCGRDWNGDAQGDHGEVQKKQRQYEKRRERLCRRVRSRHGALTSFPAHCAKIHLYYNG